MSEDYYTQRLRKHQEHHDKTMKRTDATAWIAQADCERFTPEQRARADVLFKKLGIDPDVYMSYARAQVIRASND